MSEETKHISLEELEQVYNFLFQVKMNVEKETNTFNELWESV